MSERIQGVQPKEYGGRKYRSTLEAETAETLDKMGIPFQYEERKITLQKGFRCPYQKDKVRDLTYTPDFCIGSIMLECKGFETPEWKIKKKLLFKWLMENEPETIFYQVKSQRQLLEALDNHWEHLGCSVKVTGRPTEIKATDSVHIAFFDSIAQAMEELGLRGKSTTPILRSMTGRRPCAYGYNWSLEKSQL